MVRLGGTCSLLWKYEYVEVQSDFGIYVDLVSESLGQGLSQELETGCLKLAIVKLFGIQFCKGDHNILRL